MNIIKQEFIITFLVLLVSDILLLIDTNILKLAIDINKEYVGDIKDNRVIPSSDRFLVYITCGIKTAVIRMRFATPPLAQIARQGLTAGCTANKIAQWKFCRYI